MIDRTECFLCEKAIFMYVTAVTSFGVIHFPICEDHFQHFDTDAEMNVAVMEKAIRESGNELPVEISKVIGILQESGLLLKADES